VVVTGQSHGVDETIMTNDNGFSLIESMFAITLLMIVALGLLPLGMLASATTENQGHLVARTTEYAQDKLEQLLALTFPDTTSDTRVFPAADTGGSGLTAGGSSNPDAPVALYVDYLDPGGSLLAAAGTTPPANWYYKRVWQIEAEGTNLKKVTVTTTLKSAVGGIGRIPRATVSAMKTFPF
jgi:type II secretory pathway pseudopilin PulG